MPAGGARDSFRQSSFDIPFHRAEATVKLLATGLISTKRYELLHNLRFKVLIVNGFMIWLGAWILRNRHFEQNCSGLIETSRLLQRI
jgi:hypothetical protein